MVAVHVSVMEAEIRHVLVRQLCFARVKQERVQMHRPPGVCMLMYHLSVPQSPGGPVEKEDAQTRHACGWRY